MTDDAGSAVSPALVFVVGSGRCGSTVLGDLLADHPSVVTINEYLAAVEPEPLPAGHLTGPAFAQLLSRPHPALALLLRNRVEPEELRYPIDQPGARFSRMTGLPGILASALPTISDVPDEAWDELFAAINVWPASDGAGHYRRLARWFAASAGASTVIERSGGSLRFAAELVRAFPGAHYVHIHRPGEAVASSMAAHPFFQINALRLQVARETGHDLFDDALDQHARERMDSAAPGMTPWAFDVATFQSRPPISAAEFGLLWSALLVSGVRALRSLPREQVLHVDYEELCSNPRSELRRIAKFLDLQPSPDWLASSAPRLRPPQGRLALSDNHALVRSCRAGEAVRAAVCRK